MSVRISKSFTCSSAIVLPSHHPPAPFTPLCHPCTFVSRTRQENQQYTRDFHKRGVSFKQQRQHCPDRASWATGIGSLCSVQQRRVAVCVCVCVSISRRVLRVSASIKERRLVAQELPAKCPARIPLQYTIEITINERWHTR